MNQFISDMIHLTSGEKLIKYWWLWLIILVIVFPLVILHENRKEKKLFDFLKGGKKNE